MTLKLIAVRIPESSHKYLKHKAHIEGISVQQLMATIISCYQQNDTEYMQALDQLVSDFRKKDGEGHGL